MSFVYVISDTHIGGAEHPMLGHPETLAGFFESVVHTHPDGSEVELVIAGDFVDFLVQPELKPWTPSGEEASAKLDDAIRRFPTVFAALARVVASGAHVTVLLGNHDIELALPGVQERLLQELRCDVRSVLFWPGDVAYRIGDVLIEHGNRYDAWNAIDHAGLADAAAQASRGHPPSAPLEVCPGSHLVHEVINPLKARRYHFVDLLKPEDKIVLLLLLAFEPTLRFDLPLIFGALRRRTQSWWREQSATAPGLREVGAAPQENEILPRDLEELFAAELATSAGPELVSSGKWRKLFLGSSADSLQEAIRAGAPIDGRIAKIRAALKAALNGDRSFDPEQPDGRYHAAAKSIIARGLARVVVMGHTHLARACSIESGWYINTGTWADLITIDPALFEPEAVAALTELIVRLATNDLAGVRQCRPHYFFAEVDADRRLRSTADFLRPFNAPT